jgi:hypothetical protein
LAIPCLVGTFPAASPDGGSAKLCPDAALYCDFADYVCGRGTPGGLCTARSACQDDDGALCGCDGVVYASSCAAHAAGTDIDTKGGCQLAGSFFCGGRACKLDAEACVAHVSHIDGSIHPSCVPIGDECLAALVSREDRFCECVTPGRCSVCEVVELADGTGIIKLCGDR